MSLDISKYEAVLKEQLATLTSELNDLGIQNPAVPADWQATPADPASNEADPNDLGDRVEDWNERRATLATLEVRYNNITRALAKITDGTYGVCEISGEQIEADRLDANPAARTNKANITKEADLTN